VTVLTTFVNFALVDEVSHVKKIAMNGSFHWVDPDFHIVGINCVPVCVV